MYQDDFTNPFGTPCIYRHSFVYKIQACKTSWHFFSVTRFECYSEIPGPFLKPSVYSHLWRWFVEAQILRCLVVLATWLRKVGSSRAGWCPYGHCHPSRVWLCFPCFLLHHCTTKSGPLPDKSTAIRSVLISAYIHASSSFRLCVLMYFFFRSKACVLVCLFWQWWPRVACQQAVPSEWLCSNSVRCYGEYIYELLHWKHLIDCVLDGLEKLVYLLV